MGAGENAGRATNKCMQQGGKKRKAAKRNGAEKESVPCPEGKLLKLGIGALKADRVWITELLSHRIGGNHPGAPG